jgi:flagellar biosynthetic protein FliP
MRNAFYILLLTTFWSLTCVGPTKVIDAQQVQPGTNGVVSIDGFTATDAIEDTASNLPSPVSSFPAMTLPTSADPLVTKNRNEPTNESFTPPQLQQNISPNSSLPNQLGQSEFTDLFSEQAEQLTSREGLSPSIKIGIMLGILSLAPAIILMTTCYVRLIVVLTLLRQAFGAQQLPPTQVLTALSIFITLLVMAPIWNEVKTTAIDPYTQTENGISWEEALDRGAIPIKRFMAKQIALAKNEQSVALFYQNLPDQSGSMSQSMSTNMPSDLQEVPLNVLLPAFLISELKVAFLLGFQIYLPFLILDLVVSSVTVSMGMMMLPPTMVSFPMKLILFVMVDGWNLVIGMLLQSFGPFT